MATSLLWRVVDPILLRLRSRLEHLSEVEPSDRRELTLRRKASVALSATLAPGCALDVAGSPENLSIGDHTVVFGQLATVASSAILRLGHHSFVGQGSRIWAQEMVAIGNHVLVSHLVDIHDTNSHSLDWKQRRRDGERQYERKEPLDYRDVKSAPVLIEDDVWIGFKSTILKGVRIGRGAVVAAGSVVTHDVPPFSLVAGSPARVLMALEYDVRRDDVCRLGGGTPRHERPQDVQKH